MSQYDFTKFPSGSVMCAAKQGAGSIVVVCADPDLTPLQRADKARQQVDEILARLATEHTPSTQPVQSHQQL
jgi:3-keto-L-gulonate-6-phosphate decarboxylase